MYNVRIKYTLLYSEYMHLSRNERLFLSGAFFHNIIITFQFSYIRQKRSIEAQVGYQHDKKKLTGKAGRI